MPEPTDRTPPPGATPTTDFPPNDLPPGDHPLEVAARAGIGPMSAMSQKVWHGEAIPCVSCGLLVRRNSAECDACGQDLGDEMIARMQKHAGPWYVLEHLRPFPGVTLDRVLLQVRRGLITPTSIIRGPATDHQWRFAVETPGLCRLFGRCWNCYHGIAETQSYCPSCLSHLGFEKPISSTTSVAARPAPISEPAAQVLPKQAEVSKQDSDHPHTQSHLEALAVAASEAYRSQPPAHDEPPRVGPIRAGWIAVVIIGLVLASLVWYTTIRSQAGSALSPPQEIKSMETST